MEPKQIVDAIIRAINTCDFSKRIAEELGDPRVITCSSVSLERLVDAYSIKELAADILYEYNYRFNRT
jgi:hypothetical protein